MKPPVLNLPENYYYSPINLSNENATSWEIWDRNLPNTAENKDQFPHLPVARINADVIGVWYWPPTNGTVGDFVGFESLDAAVKHLETMVGLGMVGHGYTKGMLDGSNS